jgi:hypothetical protein
MSPVVIDAVSRRFFARLALVALVFVGSFLALAILMSPAINRYDEGLILTGAMRVAAGAVPHRDFYANYGPGQFYILAGLFDLFGQTVLVERLYDLVVKAGIVCFVYVLGSYLMRPPYSALATAFCLVWVALVQDHPVYPMWPSLLLILASVWIVLPVFRGPVSAIRLFSAGLCAGGVVLFRYDMGLLALVILSAFLASISLIEPQPFGRCRRLASMLAPFWGAAGLILIVLGLVYIRYGIAGDFVFQIITYPALYYVDMRGLPFPTVTRTYDIYTYKLLEMIIYMPPAVVISYFVAMITQCSEWNSSRTRRFESWISALIACLAAGLYFKGVVRVRISQMISSIIPSLIVFGFVLDRLTSRQRISRKRLFETGALAALVVAAVVLTLVPSIIWARYYAIGIARANLTDTLEFAHAMTSKGNALGRCNAERELPRARCFPVWIPIFETVRYVVSHSAPGQPIFVANGLNDKTFANDVALYFLAGRQPATKWHQFDPGLQNSEPIQAEMVEELERNRPPLVILSTDFDDINEPNSSARHSGVTLLDDYIRKNYRTAAHFAPFTILQRV